MSRTSSAAGAAPVTSPKRHTGSNPFPLATNSIMARSAKACNLCRKMKQRCDAVERFPQGCSRCHRRNVPCEFDGNRVRANWVPSHTPSQPSSGAEAAAAIMMLMAGPSRHEGSDSGASDSSKSQAMNSAGSDADLSRSSFHSRNDPDVSPANGAMPDTVQNSTGTVAPKPAQPTRANVKDEHFDGPIERVLPFNTPLDDLVLGNITVSKEQIANMYFAYLEKCHPIFPVIADKLLAPGSPLFSNDRVLFWAMCSVGCVVTDVELSLPIFDYAKKQLFGSQEEENFLLRPYDEMSHVFAYIIIAYWPAKSGRFQKEVGWKYSGLALHMAMQIGLHHSASPSDFALVDQNTSARALAWIGVTVINQICSLTSGLPSTVSSTWSSIDDNLLLTGGHDGQKNSRNVDIAELIKQSRFLRLYSRAAAALCGNSDLKYGLALPQARYMLYKTFCDEISTMVNELSPMSYFTEMVALSCKLNLHSIMLLPGTLEQDTKNVIIPIFVVCVQITSLLTKMIESNIDKLILPQHFTRITVMATVTLYRLLASNYKHLVDERAALNAIAEGYRFLRSVHSVFSSYDEENGLSDKKLPWTLKMLGAIQIMYANDALSSNMCTISTRLGTSLFVSTIIEVIKWRAQNVVPDHHPNYDNGSNFVSHANLAEKANSTSTNTSSASPSSVNGSTAASSFIEDFPIPMDFDDDPDFEEFLRSTTWGIEV